MTHSILWVYEFHFRRGLKLFTDCRGCKYYQVNMGSTNLTVYDIDDWDSYSAAYLIFKYGIFK